MKILATVLFLALYSNCLSQNLILRNGENRVEITKSRFLKVGAKATKEQGCCDFLKFSGHFLSLSQDSVRFNFSKSVVTKELALDKSELDKTLFDYNPYKTIAKKDLLFIEDYKSEKSLKRRDALAIVGGVISIMGLSTAFSALFVKENKTELLLLGGSQLAFGLTLGICSTKKSKKFIGDDPWIID
jgi:hypothetical protein